MKKHVFYTYILSCFAFSLVQAQDFDLELYCAKISATTDKINGSVSYKSPLTNPIIFSRFPKKNGHIYMIQLNKVTKYKSSGYGVVIEFENGAKIKRHLKVAIRINDDTEFEHFINFKLEDHEVELFKNQLIKEVTLHQLQFIPDSPQKYQAYLKCIEKL